MNQNSSHIAQTLRPFFLLDILFFFFLKLNYTVAKKSDQFRMLGPLDLGPCCKLDMQFLEYLLRDWFTEAGKTDFISSAVLLLKANKKKNKNLQSVLAFCVQRCC